MWFFENIKNKIVGNPVTFALDVVLTALLIYGIIAFLKKNNAVRLVLYILPFTLIGVVLSSPKLDMLVSGKILSYTVVFAILAVVLLFPQETKRGLLKLASPKDTHEAYATEYAVSDDVLHHTISEIVRASQNMAKKNVGALIVITTQEVPEHILESGTKLDSILSCALLESIFNTKAPLHDGAVFVRGNRIVAAGCFLPLSQSTTIDKELGTRHRAAIGVTENYNVLTIIVSEETGVISTAQHGRINRYYDSQMLTEKLEQAYGLKAVKGGKNRKKEG
ncbi:MAG: diadenylate cyclase CdaA [Clostridiales bacterium]|nr:diadenylate cyclase CdaA [Clostridiales bacterium]